jgi:hypothetical protein
MKTAMQELMDYLNEDEFTGICDIRDRIEELLEKEKEQIIQAHGLKYYDIGEVTITGENYYNQNYNQIKR